jgi:hypothetical protein
MPRRALVSCALLVCLVVVLGLAASPARADGDPASDVLYTQNIFLPYARPSASVADALQRQVDAVWATGTSRLKVAVIANQQDLGSIPSLFNKPVDYASFLGQELTLLYHGPLLVVMPAGFGLYEGGGSTAAEQRALKDVRIDGPTPDELTKAATNAAARMLQAGALGKKDTIPPQASILAATGRRGRPVKLRYRMFDESGRSGATLEIAGAGPRKLATLRVPFHSVNPTVTYAVVWKVPKRLAARSLSICLTAVDEAGNRSARVCSRLRIV